jgi:hypothetical protein
VTVNEVDPIPFGRMSTVVAVVDIAVSEYSDPVDIGRVKRTVPLARSVKT